MELQNVHVVPVELHLAAPPPPSSHEPSWWGPEGRPVCPALGPSLVTVNSIGLGCIFFMLFFRQDEYTNSIVFLLEKLFWWCGVICYNNVLKHFPFKRLFTWFEVCWHCVLYRMLTVKNKLIVADPESQRLLHTTLWLLQVPACAWVYVCVRLCVCVSDLRVATVWSTCMSFHCSLSHSLQSKQYLWSNYKPVNQPLLW